MGVPATGWGLEFIAASPQRRLYQTQGQLIAINAAYAPLLATGTFTAWRYRDAWVLATWVADRLSAVIVPLGDAAYAALAAALQTPVPPNLPEEGGLSRGGDNCPAGVH